MPKHPSLLFLPGLLWLGVVVQVKVLSMGQLELLNYLIAGKQITDVKLNFVS